MSNLELPLLNATVSSAYRTAGLFYVNTTTGSSRRYQVYEIEFGQTGSLASTDIQVQWDVSRFANTAGIAGSSIVPNLFDPGDASPLCVAFNNVTTEPTNITTAGNGLNLKNWGINQRGSYRWRALDDGDNIIVPAAIGIGIAVRELSAGGTISSMSAVGNMSFIER